MISYLPDINVWLALTWDRHIHTQAAARWWNALSDDASILFCRITQLGLLRLLTTSQVMSTDVLNTFDAWRTYDRWTLDRRVDFAPEPRQAETVFRQSSAPHSTHTAPKTWGDCYLIAFTIAGGCRLVTFDKALARLAGTLQADVQLLE